MATASDLLELARGELGVKESPAGSNNVKYNTEYYRGKVSGSRFNWCAVFIWWLFRHSGAAELYYGGEQTAYCPALMSFHRGQAVSGDYRPGDVVFFNFDGGSAAKHVGLCESWDGTCITTIDGNTGTTSEANGGAVMRRRRNKKYIVGAYRPKYEAEGGDEDMDVSKLTETELLQLAARIDQARAKLAPSDWSEDAREWAEKNGVISGDSQGNKQYKKACTREELVQILYNQKKGDA